MRARPALFALLVLAACDPTLAAAPPHASVAREIHAPPLELCWVEYGTDRMPGSYGLAGGSDELEWSITYSGLLIRHPGGHLLLDAGNSSHFTEEIRTSGFFSGLLQRAIQGGGTVVATAPEALARVGEPPASLKGVVISHIHADHAGGVMDLPSTPVLLSPEELAFLRREKDSGGFDVVRAQAVSIEGRAQPIQFEGGPYENFDRSADYFGDGSVVFVPLFGHTPGSIGTFVNRSPSERYFHLGDAYNTLEALEKRRGKSIILQGTDHDREEADAVAAQVGQLHARAPAVRIIPAHDRKAWQRIFGAPSTCLPGARP